MHTEEMEQRDFFLAGETIRKSDTRKLVARELARCAGVLSHIAEVDMSLRRLLHPIWADLNKAEVHQLWQSQPQADVRVVLSGRSRLHFVRWLTCSMGPPFRQMLLAHGTLSLWGHNSEDPACCEDLARKSQIKVFETDVAGSHGWSYHVCGADRIADGVWPPEQQGRSINWKELWTIVELVRREGPTLQLWGWRVLVRCDNKAAIHTNFR